MGRLTAGGPHRQRGRSTANVRPASHRPYTIGPYGRCRRGIPVRARAAIARQNDQPVERVHPLLHARIEKLANVSD